MATSGPYQLTNVMSVIRGQSGSHLRLVKGAVDAPKRTFQPDFISLKARCIRRFLFPQRMAQTMISLSNRETQAGLI